MDDLDDLIDRLEKAAEPERELDWRIHGLLLNEPWDKIRHLDELGCTPRFTASIDAARSIGGGYLCVYASDIGADGLALVRLVADTGTDDPIVEYTGIHSRIEIAWCIAALKAKAAT